MEKRWAWGCIVAGEQGPGSLKIYNQQEFFDSKESAKLSLQNDLDTYPDHSTEAQAAKLLRTAGWRGDELMIACPPRHVWVVYPIPHGQSLDQAGVFFLEDHMAELDTRLMGRANYASPAPGAGCVMVALFALGAIGAAAAAWEQARWGA